MTLDDLRTKLCEAKYNPVLHVWLNVPNDIHSNRVFSIRMTDLYLKHDPFLVVEGDCIAEHTPCWHSRRSTQVMLINATPKQTPYDFNNENEEEQYNG